MKITLFSLGLNVFYKCTRFLCRNYSKITHKSSAHFAGQLFACAETLLKTEQTENSKPIYIMLTKQE